MCSPAPQLTWSKVNGRLPSGRYKTNRLNSELLIKAVTKSDEGDYKCQASNANGRDHFIVQVDVQCMSLDNDWLMTCMEYEVEGSRPRGIQEDLERPCAKRLLSTQIEQGGCYGLRKMEEADKGWLMIMIGSSSG